MNPIVSRSSDLEKSVTARGVTIRTVKVEGSFEAAEITLKR